MWSRKSCSERDCRSAAARQARRSRAARPDFECSRLVFNTQWIYGHSIGERTAPRLFAVYRPPVGTDIFNAVARRSAAHAKSLYAACEVLHAVHARKRLTRMKALFVLVLCCPLLGTATGCFTVRYSEGSELRHDRVKDIVTGVTSRAEVLSWFGAPETFTNSNLVNNVAEELEMTPQDVLQLPFSDSMVFRFTKGRVNARFLGIWNEVDVRVTADTLVVFFDEQDRVSSFGYRRGTDDLVDRKNSDSKSAESKSSATTSSEITSSATTTSLESKPSNAKN
jgi:hypothetical protein